MKSKTIMRKTFIILAVILSCVTMAQQPQRGSLPPVRKTSALPMRVYNTMRDSCNYLDIVFITGKGGSMSLDNPRSIRGFTSFVTTQPAQKVANAPLDGTLMWQINGKAYQTGNLYFRGDSAAYITFERDGKEYVNSLTPDGAGFLKTRGGK